ncbi:MAG: Ig-like domain-containing protein [Chloroflexota bacterium]
MAKRILVLLIFILVAGCWAFGIFSENNSVQAATCGGRITCWYCSQYNFDTKECTSGWMDAQAPCANYGGNEGLVGTCGATCNATYEGATFIRSEGSCSLTDPGGGGGGGGSGCTDSLYPQCSRGTCVPGRECKKKETPGCECKPVPQAPSCTVELTPDPVDLKPGQTQDFIATITDTRNGTVERVEFSSVNQLVAVVSPGSDSSVVYETLATALATGQTTITAEVIMAGASRCSDSSDLTVTLNTDPWWQAIDGDVLTNGDLISQIPTTASNPYLILPGTGGYPGVASYGLDEQASFVPGGKVSSLDWLAETNTRYQRAYNYDFFAKKIPGSVLVNEIAVDVITGGYLVSNGNESRGYVWFKHQGNLTVNGQANLGKMVVFAFASGNGTEEYPKLIVQLSQGELVQIKGYILSPPYAILIPSL